MNNGSRQNKRIGFHLLRNLVLSLFLIGCIENKKENNEITIQWNSEKAEAVIIPLNLLLDVARDSIDDFLQVRLKQGAAAIIHDELRLQHESIIFKPMLAFTPGLKYEVLFANKLIGEFEIPSLSSEPGTDVVSVYPTTDTLPENALKLYIVFSRPMQEGQALDHITVIKNAHDTLRATFLDLDKELWDRERTTLTLWFDPGRIKRDLQPNKNLGAPLEKNNNYKIIISESWKDGQHLSLRSGYLKSFVVGERDSISPDPAKWTVHSPKTSTKDVLSIDLNESLDYILLKNAVEITDSKGNRIHGSFEPVEKETILQFTPGDPWNSGEYVIKIESRLEDLAGNNLNRLFDKDLTRPDNRGQRSFFTKGFRVD